MLVACDSGIRTATVPAGVAPVSARAWIHGRHEHKVSWEGHVSLCPTDGHKPVLQRLPDRLKHRVRELAQLIEEEHTPVAQCQEPTLDKFGNGRWRCQNRKRYETADTLPGARLPGLRGRAWVL